jgi:hypothetical protein
VFVLFIVVLSLLCDETINPKERKENLWLMAVRLQKATRIIFSTHSIETIIFCWTLRAGGRAGTCKNSNRRNKYFKHYITIVKCT